MLCIEEPNDATERFIFTVKAIIIRGMNRSNRICKVASFILISAISLSLYAEGIGFYREPHNGYVTEEGTPYSFEASEAASNVYPIGTILSIGGEMVYVNDYFPGLPDRTILLNTYAAEKLGVLENGWTRRRVSCWPGVAESCAKHAATSSCVQEAIKGQLLMASTDSHLMLYAFEPRVVDQRPKRFDDLRVFVMRPHLF